MGPFVPPESPLVHKEITLRPISQFLPEDVDALALAMTDLDLASWLEHATGDRRADARALLEHWVSGWHRGTDATFGFFDNGQLLAVIAAIVTRDPEVAELAIWVHRESRRKGVGTKSVKLAAAWAFEAGIERLWIEIDPDNEPSHALARKAGFEREGILRSHCRDRRTNTRHDCVVYSLLPSDALAL
jgi:RimJ/RimL family protein N-acetyltransferase